MAPALAVEARDAAAACARLGRDADADLFERLATEVERLTRVRAATSAAREPLTLKQATVLGVIRSYMERHGCAPALWEIAHALGYRSLATVYEHLQHLEDKGYIRRAHNQVRAITLREEVHA